MTQPDAADPPPIARADLLGIGDLARASGVPASALRFYDREGVLVPAEVDPATGYRRYAPCQLRAARLVAALRRVGMPLADVRVVLERDGAGDAEGAREVVLAHEQRLVDGLADARREVARTLDLLGTDHASAAVVTATVPAADLGAALASVRFAVAPSAPEPVPGGVSGARDLAVLTGVLVELTPGALALVATDRYRMASAAVRLVDTGTRGPASVVAPVSWVDDVESACTREPTASVRVEVVGGLVRATFPDGAVTEGRGLPGTYPDHRVVLEGVALGPGRAVDGLVDDLPLDVDRVGLAVAGERVVVVPEELADVLVDPAFLHDALSVAGGAPLLALDGPLRPLAVRGPGGFSVLMPVRADRRSDA